MIIYESLITLFKLSYLRRDRNLEFLVKILPLSNSNDDITWF